MAAMKRLRELVTSTSHDEEDVVMSADAHHAAGALLRGSEKCPH